MWRLSFPKSVSVNHEFSTVHLEMHTTVHFVRLYGMCQTFVCADFIQTNIQGKKRKNKRKKEKKG